MPTATAYVVAGIDDGLQVGPGTWSFASATITIPPNSSVLAGIRFSALAVPPGATITSASIQFLSNGYAGFGSPTMCRLYGVAEDDCAVFSSGSPPSGRTKTSDYGVSGLWAPSGSTYTVDVTTAVADVVGRGGWASGNHLGIIVQFVGAGSASSIAFAAFESGHPAILTVDYDIAYDVLCVGAGPTSGEGLAAIVRGSAHAIGCDGATSSGGYGLAKLIAIMDCAPALSSGDVAGAIITSSSDVATVPLTMNPVYGSIQGFPNSGDFLRGGRYGGECPIRFAKVVRGQGQGIVFDIGGAPLSGGTVDAFETATPANSAGSATTDTQGSYLTGSVYGRDRVDITTAIESVSGHGLWHSRTRYRLSFIVLSEILSLGYDVSPALVHARTFVSTSTNTLWVGLAGNQAPLAWIDTDTGIPVTWARCRWAKSGQTQRLGIFYGNGTSATFALTFDGGASWDTILDMATAKVGDFEATASGMTWLYERQTPDGGTTWNVYRKILDSDMNTVIDWTETNITGIDDEQIAVRESTDGAGGWRIGLHYSVGGVPLVKLASDGLNFS